MRILITPCSNRQKYSILISQHLEQNSWLAVVVWFVLTIKVGTWNIHGCHILLWFLLAWNIGSYRNFCIGCPMILILHACSNYVVAWGSVFLISGIQNVTFVFVLEGNVQGRRNSKLEIGWNSKYLTLFYRKTYSVIMTLGNVSMHSS